MSRIVIGSKVKCTDEEHCGGFKTGDIGTVVNIRDYTEYDVEGVWRGAVVTLSHCIDCIELVEEE